MKPPISFHSGLLLVIAAFAQPQEPAKIQPQPYVLKTFDGREVQAERGELTVPEDRSSGATQSLKLGFVKLARRNQASGPPIVFLMGGPGIPGTVMGRVPAYMSLFDRLRDAGDVIVMPRTIPPRSQSLFSD